MPDLSALEQATAKFAADVRLGLLRADQKRIPTQYLYDAVGSALFEAIRVLPEYGVARAGDRVLQRYARDIAHSLPKRLVVAELGSGSARETRHVLEALPDDVEATYYPIDISGAAVVEAERGLNDIDSVHVRGVEADYFVGLAAAVSRRPEDHGLLVLFLGGTIGNFDRVEADDFLRRVRTFMLRGDRLLLSTDLMKPEAVLIRAYDDDAGVTAAFNKNLLARINRELGGDFDLTRFAHEARFNHDERRIEMHLRSLVDQRVHLREPALTVSFRAGETIWTESSHKYHAAEIGEMAARCGFHLEAQWVDDRWAFAQNMLIAD